MADENPRVVERYINPFIWPSQVSQVLIGIHAALETGVATILITHLTGDGLQLPKAASIVNVQDGLSALLLMLVVYVSDAKIGSFGTVVVTSILYFTGLLLLFFSAKKQNEGMSSLIVAAMFIAAGRSGRDVSLKQFLDDQCKAEWPVKEGEKGKMIESGRYQECWRIASVLGVIVSIFVSLVYKDIEWVELCKISVITMGLGFAFFLAGIPFYLVIHTYSSSASHNQHINMDTTSRWVDNKDATGDVKSVLSMIPLWTTFLTYGLLQATANVFFYEQVDYMQDPRIGLISKVPVVVFAVMIKSTSFGVSYVCGKWFASYWGEMIPRHVMLVRIGVGLAIAPVCCVIAWRVESYEYGISRNGVWLIPQFVLLGILDGLVYDGIVDLFYASVSKSLKKYGPALTQFAPNIGHFISLALVLNLRSMFGDGLGTSNLGLSYAILSYVCLVNFMFYCYVATHFVKPREGESFDQDEEIAD